MAATISLDLTDIQPADVDRPQFVDAAGWYLCTLDDVGENKNGDSWEFSFIVSKDRFKGCTIHVWLPNNPANARDYAKAKNRIFAFAKRLGITTEEQMEAAKKAGKNIDLDFYSAVGKPFVVRLVDEREKGADGKWRNTGRVQAEYIPIYPPDHEAIPSNTKTNGTAKNGSTGATNGAAAAGTNDKVKEVLDGLGGL